MNIINHDNSPSLNSNLPPPSVDVRSYNALADRVSLRNEYYILRHGRAISNELRVVSCSPSDCLDGHGLVELGKESALSELEKRVKDGTLDSNAIFVSSDFLRARETTELAMNLTGAREVIFTPSLRERNLGNLHGSSGDAVHPAIMAADRDNPFNKTNPLSGEETIESPLEVQARMTALIGYLETRYENRKIVIVSHHDPIRILQTGFLQQSAQQYLELPKVPNCILHQQKFIPNPEGRIYSSAGVLNSGYFNEVLDDHCATGSEIIDRMKSHPLIRYAFLAKPRDAYIMEIEEHTACVLDQFKKYFPDFISPHLSYRAFCTLLVVHDLGTPFQSRGSGQHEQTLRIIDELGPSLPIEAQELEIIRALVNGDALGTYAQKLLKKPPSAERRAQAMLLDQGKLSAGVYQSYCESFSPQSISDIMNDAIVPALTAIRQQSQQADIPLADFYHLLKVYYQSDVASYSLDAGAYPALEGLLRMDFEMNSDRIITKANRPEKMFVFNKSKDRLLFCSHLERAFTELENCI